MKLRRLMQNCPSRTKPTKARRCASQQNWLANDAVGQTRRIDKLRRSRHVRFVSNSDRLGGSQRTVASCHKRPNAPQQKEAYSITSSARAMSVGGTSRPSAFAVLRLMISSTFTTCWTGRSAGLSPFRIRPV
jgi:hypothetical protein